MLLEPGGSTQADRLRMAYRCVVIRTGPRTVFPVACTEPVSGGGRVPRCAADREWAGDEIAVDLYASGVPTRSAGPVIEFPPHGARRCVAADEHEARASTDRERVGDQCAAEPNDARALADRTGPLTVAPSRSSEPPVSTVTGPL